MNSDLFDSTFYDTWIEDDDIRCVAGTMALEGMSLSESGINNIERLKLGEDVYTILNDIKDKYIQIEGTEK